MFDLIGRDKKQIIYLISGPIGVGKSNFVVEDELDWFCKRLSDLNVDLIYI
jgi:hypothetical protein